MADSPPVTSCRSGREANVGSLGIGGGKLGSAGEKVLESLCGSENSKGNRAEELNLEKVGAEGE